MSAKPLFLSILVMLGLALLTGCGGGGNQAALPAAPGTVTATPGEGRITLTWEDRSDDETEFVIYREVVRENLSVQALEQLATVPANTTTYTDPPSGPPLVATTSYRYAVAARNAAGESPRVEIAEPVQPEPDAGTARLSITQVGGGQGVVTSIPTGIECIQRPNISSDCTEDYPEGTEVTLSAQPDAGSLFAGWGGACSGTGACRVSMSASRTVSATFVKERSVLTVAKVGTGSGTVLDVNSSGGLINCGADCTESLRTNEDVIVLEARAAEGSLFAGWENCPDTRTGDRCWVRLEDDLTVTARFSQPSLNIVSFTASPASAQPGSEVTLSWNVSGDDPYTLTLTNSATGATQDVTGQTSATVTVTGSVTYTLIAKSFAEEKTRNVTLTVGKAPAVTLFKASPTSITAEQEVRLEWEVAGLGDIVVTISGVTGTFGPKGQTIIKPKATTTYVLTATSEFGVAVTTATSKPPSVTVRVGIAPSLSPITATPSTLILPQTQSKLSWSAGGTETTLTLRNNVNATELDVTGQTSADVTQNRTTTYELTATNPFGPAVSRTVTVTVQASLTVNKTGLGSGTVTSAPSENGINCGPTCPTANANFPAQSNVNLTAAPASDSEFVGWSGDGSGTTTRSVTMDDDKTVTANFRLKPLLTVRVTGNGTVTGTGISCDPECTERYNTGTTVNLTANLNNGFSVTWTGCNQVDDNICTVTMNESKTVIAAFTQTPAVNSVTVTPDSATINVGETEQLQATVSTVGDASETVTWTSSNTDVATVNASGLVTGVGAGTATITATSTADSSKSDTATITVEPNLVPLNVTISGNGQVSFSPTAAATCTATCTRTFAQDTSVELSATPGSDSNFTGWSGEGCTGAGTCTVFMTEARNVTASFTLKPAVNNVTVTPDSATINVGETEQLQATVSTVGGASETVTWTSSDDYVATVNASGLVTGVGAGTATITATSTAHPSKSDTASVTVLVPVRTLDVAFTGSGAGTVNFSPSGDPCTADCTRSYAQNTQVSLSATPDPGSDFTGWGGDCSSDTCTLVMDGDKSVSATFTLQSFSLSVSKTGMGSGTVTSADGGITCGEDCTEAYFYNASVTLSATPDGGSAFAGWDGDCLETSCQLSMTDNRSVQAAFFALAPEPEPGEELTGMR